MTQHANKSINNDVVIKMNSCTCTNTNVPKSGFSSLVAKMEVPRVLFCWLTSDGLNANAFGVNVKDIINAAIDTFIVGSCVIW